VIDMENNENQHEMPEEKAEEKLEAEQLKAQNEELLSDLKRLAAEFENYQKRTEKEKESASERGKLQVLKKMISLADEFDAAITHMHTSSESELRSGIRLLQKKLLSVLEEEGVEPLECIGSKFDPDVCDAVEMVEDEGEEGVIVKEMRKGYKCKGVVLRHSMVGVTKKKNGA
jgi:molecular chaperone GrpE